MRIRVKPIDVLASVLLHAALIGAPLAIWRWTGESPAGGREPRVATHGPARMESYDVGLASSADDKARNGARPATPRTASDHTSPAANPAALPAANPKGRSGVGSPHQEPAGGEVATADVSLYAARLSGLINARLRYPRAAQREHLEGTVRVSLRLRSDGALAEVHVSSSSGNERLDEAALEAVRKAAPFPAPPASSQLGELRFTQAIDFKLD